MGKSNKKLADGQKAAIALIKKTRRFVLMVPDEDPEAPPRVFALGYTTPSRKVDYSQVAMVIIRAAEEVTRQSRVNPEEGVARLRVQKEPPKENYGDGPVIPDAAVEENAGREG